MFKGIKGYQFFGNPVDVLKVLQAFYDLDRQNPFADCDSRVRFQRNLYELLNENTEGLYLTAKYFVHQLLEEIKKMLLSGLTKILKIILLKSV